MGKSTIRVEHPDSHQPTKAQLKEAGVDPDAATSYVNESGVATVYSFDDEPADAPEAAPKKLRGSNVEPTPNLA